MRCEGHNHVGDTLVICDLEPHGDDVPHQGWLRCNWHGDHAHGDPSGLVKPASDTQVGRGFATGGLVPEPPPPPKIVLPPDYETTRGGG